MKLKFKPPGAFMVVESDFMNIYGLLHLSRGRPVNFIAIQMIAIERYLFVVQFITLYKVVLTFESVNEILILNVAI